MAAPAWVRNQSSTVPASESTSFTPTLPSSPTAGNLLLMAVWMTRGTAAVGTLTTPSGWTLVVDGTTLFGFSTRCRLYIYAKIAGSSETAPSLTCTTGAVWHVETSECSGAGTPLVGVGGSTSSGTSVATPAITTVSADNLLVYVLGSNTDFDEVTAAPSGSTLRVHRQDAQFGSYVAIADKTQATATTVAASSFTRNHTQFPCIAHSVAIPPAGPAVAAFVPQITIV